MLKKSVSKAAADGSTGGIASGYVEDTYEGRTTLAGCFSILLCRREKFDDDRMIHSRRGRTHFGHLRQRIERRLIEQEAAG